MAEKNEINELVGTTGYTEKPAYLEGELTKALDIKVDELIGAPPTQGPKTVPESVYNDLLDDFENAINDLADLQDKLNKAEAEISDLESQLEVALQSKNACEVLRAQAENISQTINQRFQDLLIDFQQALQKGIKEAIERVSLTAQVNGLTAQKKALERIIETKDDQIDALNQQIDSLQQRIAAAEAVDQGGGVGTNSQQPNSDWKLPGSEIVESSKQLYIKTENDKDVRILQGSAINLYNLNDTTSQTFTFSVSYDSDSARGWLKLPTSITVPSRQGDKAGKGYIDVQWKNIQDSNQIFGGRKQTHLAYVNVKSSLGDSFRIRAEYFKEVDRKDTWGARPTGTPTAHPGQEKN